MFYAIGFLSRCKGVGGGKFPFSVVIVRVEAVEAMKLMLATTRCRSCQWSGFVFLVQRYKSLILELVGSQG